MSAHHKEIIKYEYKRFFSWRLWIWIGACCVLNMLLWGFKYNESEQELIFKEIVEQYRGISTKEKICDIYEKTEYFSWVLDQHLVVAEDYARGDISDEEFQHFMDDYKYARKTINGWLKLYENANRFEKQANTTYFFYDVAWEKLFRNDMGCIFIFLSITLWIPYFYLDRDSALRPIEESYFNYKKIKRYRLCYAMLLGVVLQMVWTILELGIVLSMSTIPDASATVCSISVCKEVSGTISIIQFYVLKNLAFLLKRIIDVGFVYFISEKFKSKMQTTVFTLVYLAITNLGYVEILKEILR